MPTIDVKSMDRSGNLWRCEVVVGGTTEVFMVSDDADLDRQVLAREAAKARTVTLGVRDVTAPTPVAPTQEEIDLAAFSALCRNYRNSKAEFDATVGTTTQADLDALVVEIKAAYLPEYAPLIVGLF